MDEVGGFCLDCFDDDAPPFVLRPGAPFLAAFDVLGRGEENAERFRFVTAAVDVEGMKTWFAERNQ